MADPIELQIVQSLQQAMQSVTVGDGYHYDVRGTAVKLNPDHDVEPLVEEGAPRPFVTLEVTPEAWVYQPANRVKLEMPVRVHWFDETDLDGDVLLQMAYRAYSDIERAVTRDLRRGERAVDTRITQRAAVMQGSSVWVAVDLLVTVIRTFGEASV